MANGPTPIPPAPPPQALILDQLRDQLEKLHQQLRGLQALSRGLLAGLVSAALIVFSSWPDTKPISEEFANRAMGTMAILAGLAVLIEATGTHWRQGADINDLIARYVATAHLPQCGHILELALTRTFITNLRSNRLRVSIAKLLVAVHACGTFFAGGVLLAVLLGIYDIT